MSQPRVSFILIECHENKITPFIFTHKAHMCSCCKTHLFIDSPRLMCFNLHRIFKTTSPKMAPIFTAIIAQRPRSVTPCRYGKADAKSKQSNTKTQRYTTTVINAQKYQIQTKRIGKSVDIPFPFIFKRCLLQMRDNNQRTDGCTNFQHH